MDKDVARQLMAELKEQRESHKAQMELQSEQHQAQMEQLMNKIAELRVPGAEREGDEHGPGHVRPVRSAE